MRIIPIKVDIDGVGYEIGRLERWTNDPETFDGWLEETPGGVTDELVVNGATEWWARYLVLARYMETLMAEIKATDGRKQGGDFITVNGASNRLSATAEEMEVALAAHLAKDD